MNSISAIVLVLSLFQSEIVPELRSQTSSLSLTVNVVGQEFLEIKGTRATLILHVKLKYENRGSTTLILSKHSNELPRRYLISIALLEALGAATKSDSDRGKFESVIIPTKSIFGSFGFKPFDQPPNQNFTVLKSGESLELNSDVPLAGSLPGYRLDREDLVFDGTDHFFQLEMFTFPYSENMPRMDCSPECRIEFQERWKDVGVLWSQPIRSEPVRVRLSHP